ncbi:MAG TPA: translation initiation factor IF-2 [Polyangia bacterium]|jgi:translation initiation factor IF-2|nr:translation initiation factor IF-2 [Polyangia bacterium]
MIGSGNTTEAPTGPRVRIYELAKELSLGHKEMVAKVRSLGIEVANHMSHLDPADVDRVRRAVTRERKESTTEERLNDTVIRRRSKSVPGPAPTAKPAAPAPVAAKPAPAVVREAVVEPPPPPPAPVRVVETKVEAKAEVKEAPAPASVVEPKVEVKEAPAPEPAKPAAAAAAPVVAKAPAPAPVVEVKVERKEEPAPAPAPAAPKAAAPEVAPQAPPAAPAPVIRTIPQAQITGSAATGAFIHLPGLAPRGEAGAPRIEIRDRDAEQRARGGLMNRPGGGPGGRFQRPGGGPGGGPGNRYGGPPRKKVAAAGKKLKQTQITTPAEHKRVIRMGDTISVSDLAQKMAIKGKEIIKKLWALGMMGVNINQDVDLDTATLIATEFGYQVESTAFNEESVLTGNEQPDNPEDLLPRAPVVTIMGHVDHGKTSLLDAIRKANVAAGEAGGITQHIGAYKVSSERGDVVFLDTPGHEAFTAMRARGAQMTDIVVLVVAADDGPMPQTIEAINHAKEAGVPIVVAINKIDKPGANPDQIRNKLSEHGLVSEEWGGDTIFVPVSAKTKEGIDKLLEMLALQSEVLELRANPNKAARGHVVEARLDRARGPVSTILVEEGTLKIGDLLVAGEYSGKIRAMLGDKGQNITEAGPSTPVEILGLDGVPDAGELFNVVADEKAAKSLVEHRHDARRKKELAGSANRVSLENILDKIKSGDVKEVKVVLKADVQGSIEAIANALTKLSTNTVGVNVISSGVGGITESDVSLAKASAAIVIGFNVRPAGKAAQLAEQEGVDIKLYQVIYDAIDDVKKAMVGMLAPISREKILGKVEIRQVFNIPKAGTIGGAFVLEGKITRKAQLRLVRDSVVLYTGKVGSLRRFKDDASEVAQGYECGVSIEGYQDLREGDIIEAFELETIAPTLENPTGK